MGTGQGHQEALPWVAGDAPEFHLVQQAVHEQLTQHPDAVRAFAACAHLEAYTDGSAPVANPGGPAGFAAVLLGWPSSKNGGVLPAARLDVAGHIPPRQEAPSTSNNRAEVAAIMAALALVCALPEAPSSLLIYSDSDYAINCAVGRYQRRKNLDLWACYDPLSQDARARVPDLRLEWLRGHAGNRWNEAADDLATAAAFQFDAETIRRYRAAQRATRREMPGAAAVAAQTPLDASRKVTQTPLDASRKVAQTPLDASRKVIQTPLDASRKAAPPEGFSGSGRRDAHYLIRLQSAAGADGAPASSPICDSGSIGRYQLRTHGGNGMSAYVHHTGAHSAEASEYLTMIAALDDLLGRIDAAGRDPSSFTVVLYSGSEAVIRQLDGSEGVHDPALQPVHQKARARLDRLGGVEIRQADA